MCEYIISKHLRPNIHSIAILSSIGKFVFFIQEYAYKVLKHIFYLFCTIILYIYFIYILYILHLFII